jgi:hypothetical protein
VANTAEGRTNLSEWFSFGCGHPFWVDWASSVIACDAIDTHVTPLNGSYQKTVKSSTSTLPSQSSPAKLSSPSCGGRNMRVATRPTTMHAPASNPPRYHATYYRDGAVQLDYASLWKQPPFTF